MRSHPPILHSIEREEVRVFPDGRDVPAEEQNAENADQIRGGNHERKGTCIDHSLRERNPMRMHREQECDSPLGRITNFAMLLVQLDERAPLGFLRAFRCAA
jgi:hypothetical protein